MIEGRSFQFEDFSHKLPKYKLITWERLLKTFIHAAILHDVRIYRVHMGNVKNRDPQRPNVSKYVGSASNSFLYALEACLVNLMP